MTLKSLTATVLIVATVTAVTLTYMQVQDANSDVLLCIAATQECTIYKDKEVKAAYGSSDGYCIVVGLKSYCRPDFEIFHFKDYRESLFASCAKELKGEMEVKFYDICQTSEGEYQYDPFKDSWKPL